MDFFWGCNVGTFQTTSQEWKINQENLRIMNFYTFYVMVHRFIPFQRFTIWVPSWNSIANTKCKGWTTHRWVWITGQTLKTQMKQFWFGVTPVDTLMPCIFCLLPLHSLRDHLHLPEKSKVHLNAIKNWITGTLCFLYQQLILIQNALSSQTF